MSFFFQFPDVIIVTVLSQYCEIKSLAHLDSSLCNKSERHFLLEIFKSSYFHLDGVDNESLTGDAYFKWIISRGVQPYKFHMTGKSVFAISPQANRLLKLRSSKLESIIFTQCSSEFFTVKLIVKFINSAPKLNTLYILQCYRFDDELLTNINNEIVAQLTDLNLYKCSQITGISLRYIALHCVKLVKFSLSVEVELVSEDIICSIVQSNPSLTHLFLDITYLDITDALIDCITQYGKQLVELTIVSIVPLSLTVCTKIIKSCAQLRVFETLGKNESQGQFLKYKIHTKRYRTSEPEKYSTEEHKHINLGHHHSSGEALRQFFTDITRFHYIDFMDTPAVQNNVLRVISKYSKCLEHLHLGNHRLDPRYTCEGLARILNKCVNLSTLTLEGCQHLTEDELVSLFLLNPCDLLTKLSLRHFEMSDTAVEMIKDKWPDIRIVL